MAIPDAKDLRCPRCLKADRVRPASSTPARFPSPLGPIRPTTSVSFLGAIMLAYLVGSLPVLAGKFSQYPTHGSPMLSALGDLLPRPLPWVVVGVICLLVAFDRPSRDLLVRLARTAVLDPRLCRELDALPASHARAALSVGLASFGWGVFQAMRSLDVGLGAPGSQGLLEPEWLPAALQGFLFAAVTALIGWSVSSWLVSHLARSLAEGDLLEATPTPFGTFARNLGYAYSLLPLLLGLAWSSGSQIMVVPAFCWFLASMTMAVRQTMNQGTLEAFVATLAGAGLPSMVLFLVPSTVLLRAATSSPVAARESAATLLDVQSLWMASALVLAMVLVLLALLPAAWGRWKAARLPRTRRQASLRWERLLYCERCDGVHLANQREFVPASESAGLLLPWEQGQPRTSLRDANSPY